MYFLLLCEKRLVKGKGEGGEIYRVIHESGEGALVQFHMVVRSKEEDHVLQPERSFDSMPFISSPHSAGGVRVRLQCTGVLKYTSGDHSRVFTCRLTLTLL